MKFYVTGISGFICRHLANRLCEEGHEVDAAWHHSMNDELPMVHPRIRFVDSFSLRVNKYDAIYHMAATTTITNDFNEGIWFNNAVYAEMIMNQPFRTIYASSTSVYEMTSPYSHSKAFLEHLGNRHGNALGLRLFNVYGPGNNKGIVKKVIDCCLSGETLTLQGGDQIRDFIYVDDVVDIMIDHLENTLKVMDVGTGIGTKIHEVINEVALQMRPYGKPLKLVMRSSDYAGEQMESIARSHPVKEYTTLREGIRKTIELTLNQK